MQQFSTLDDKHAWRKTGCKIKDGVWLGPNEKPCLPRHFFPHYAKLTNGFDHVSKGGMLDMIEQHWFTEGFTSTRLYLYRGVLNSY